MYVIKPSFKILQSTCFMQEEDKTRKDKGRNRSTTDVTVSKVDPQKDTPLNKLKALKLRNPFSPKSKVKIYSINSCNFTRVIPAG